MGRAKGGSVGYEARVGGIVEAMFDCTTPVQTATDHDLMSACMQAEATLLAGSDQALAAYWAGAMTLFAGVFAFAAGFLAYNASKKLEKEDERRRKLNVFLKAQHMDYSLTHVAPLRLKAAQLSFCSRHAEYSRSHVGRRASYLSA